ncbi:MAG: hypothetical protein AB1861_05070 [Cyanobacteriota bacterium]
MSNIAETQLAPPPVPTSEILLAYQKKQMIKQLDLLQGALNRSCTTHQQHIEKLQRQLSEDRRALKEQIKALREAIEQLGSE